MGGGWDAGLSQAKLTGLILVAVNGAPATITIETCEDPGDWTTAVGGAGWASHGGGGAFLGFSSRGRGLPVAFHRGGALGRGSDLRLVPPAGRPLAGSAGPTHWTCAYGCGGHYCPSEPCPPGSSLLLRVVGTSGGAACAGLPISGPLLLSQMTRLPSGEG